MCLAVFQMYKPNEPVTIWKFKSVVQLYFIVIMLYILCVFVYIDIALENRIPNIKWCLQKKNITFFCSQMMQLCVFHLKAACLPESDLWRLAFIVKEGHAQGQSSTDKVWLAQKTFHLLERSFSDKGWRSWSSLK